MSTPSPAASKFFTHRWAITLPSHPNIKFIRSTPDHFDAWIALVTDPGINESLDSKDKIWDEDAVKAWKDRARVRYEEAPVKQGPLELLLAVDGNIVGFGGLFPPRPGALNIGLALSKAVRGRGNGKLMVQVMAQIAFDLGYETVDLGTMMANQSMRAVMASLGVEEREERVIVEGRGLVAELLYDIKREDWKRVDMIVEFQETPNPPLQSKEMPAEV